MSKYTICNKCGGKRHKQSKSGLCYKCWLEKVRKESPYISGKKASGGSQWKDNYGKTHYQKNKEKYLRQTRERKRRNQQMLIDYKKTLKCLDCGISDFRVIDFDHKPGIKKVISVSQMPNKGYSWNKIMKEIEKCEPRCANCHRIKTWKRKNATIS